MAEEEFDVSDMPTTNRYQIPYPGPDNLVRFAADQFGAMANAIDKQLGNVDDRQTDAARSTIVRPTLEQLQQATAAQGQFGYVTADPTADNIGIWIYSGDTWSRVSGATPLTVVKNTLAELQAVTNMSEGVFGLVTADPVASNNGAYIWYGSQWSPITAAAGKALTAETLESLQATTAPTGTLGYVSADETASNNGVYVMTSELEWEPVGGRSASMAVPVSQVPDSAVIVTNRYTYGYSEAYQAGISSLPDIAVTGTAKGRVEKTVYNDDGFTGLAAIKLAPGLYRITDYTWSGIRYKIFDESESKPIVTHFTGSNGTDYLRSGEWVYVLNSTCVVFYSGAMLGGTSGGNEGDKFIHSENTSHDPGLPVIEVYDATLLTGTSADASSIAETPGADDDQPADGDTVIDAPGDLADITDTTDTTTGSSGIETVTEPAADTTTTTTTDDNTTTPADTATGQTTTSSSVETTTTPAVAHTLPEWPTTGTETA